MGLGQALSQRIVSRRSGANSRFTSLSLLRYLAHGTLPGRHGKRQEKINLDEGASRK